MKSNDLSLLVVDDEEDVRKLMKELLTGNVKKLYLAKNGIEALDILGSYQIDVVS